MQDKKYWLNLINNLIDKKHANDAAHTLASNLDYIDEILTFIDKKKLISNCLQCYEVDKSAQPYLDEILTTFTVYELVDVYKNLSRKPIEVAGSLMWLLEDIDPEFTFMDRK